MNQSTKYRFRHVRIPPSFAYRSARRGILAASLALLFTFTTNAATLTINVTGIEAPLGSIGCSLFPSARGFPMDNNSARVQWLPATGGRVTCSFDNVAPGRYAVSIGHDVNGNRRVDTNLFGIPTEQWGVSNNVRPSLRAPSFDEAAITLAADGSDVTLEIKVSK